MLLHTHGSLHSARTSGPDLLLFCAHSTSLPLFPIPTLVKVIQQVPSAFPAGTRDKPTVRRASLPRSHELRTKHVPAIRHCSGPVGCQMSP